MNSKILWIGILILSISRCDSGDDGVVVSNSAQLLSSTLAARAACTASSNRCTPANVSGDICYAYLGMGDFDGGGYFGMTWLAPADSFPEGPKSGTCSTVLFDLSSSTTFSGKLKIPASESDMPDTRSIFRTELNFNYVDVTFTISGSAGADGTYTVRTVFAETATADDVTGTMEQGDKLYKASGESAFKWCNSSTCSTDRSTVETGLIQDPVLTEYYAQGKYSEDERTSYIPVVANFTTAASVTYSDISDSSKTWKLDFSVTDGIKWEDSATPSAFTTVRDVLDKFHLKFYPNKNEAGESDDGVRASLTIE